MQASGHCPFYFNFKKVEADGLGYKVGSYRPEHNHELVWTAKLPKLKDMTPAQIIDRKLKNMELNLKIKEKL
jgi:hypothetical protein